MIETNQLRKIPRFATLGLDACQWVARRLRQRHYRKNSHLFEQGQLCDHLYLIEGGEVKFYKFLENGREVIIDFYHAGDAVGEAALLDGIAYEASAKAHGDVDVLTLCRSQYLEFMREFPEVAQAVIRDMNRRKNALHRRIESLSVGNVENRIAQVLMLLSSQIGKESDGNIELPLHLSRQELASMVGARIETVIRIMSRWQKQGVIESYPKGITLRQPSSLEVFQLVN